MRDHTSCADQAFITHEDLENVEMANPYIDCHQNLGFLSLLRVQSLYVGNSLVLLMMILLRRQADYFLYYL